MTTPRTIKASEVRKGMRVCVEESLGEGTTQTTEGSVLSDASPTAHPEFVDLGLDGVTIGLDPDHPVTVLADPEPEWVDGAWYRCQVNMTGDGVKVMRRGVGGWTSFENGPWTYQDAAVTVLGRVLIVDWPGDDLAARLTSRPSPDTVTRLLADAIRTQGGVR